MSAAPELRPELREDPLGRFQVWIAPARAGRPNEFRATGATASISPPPVRIDCPFCEGNERATTPEVLALRPQGSAPNGPGWAARIVTNLYPAMTPEHGGRHEVLIETPRHSLHPADFEVDALTRVLELLRDRTRALVDLGYPNVTLFRNTGPRAGASLSHPHSQIVALQAVPPQVERERGVLAEHGMKNGRCRVCAVVADEREAKTRVIAEHGGFVCFAPYASRFHCEMAIAPLAHPAPFAAADRATLGALGAALKDALSRLRRVLDDPPFNVVMNCAVDADPWHWRVEILPRVTGLGGFELGAGAFINSMPPEAAAAWLRGDRTG